MAHLEAPFTPEQVRGLNAYQASGKFHPFTCGTKDKHAPGADEVLVADVDGWACPSCDYRQGWAHSWMAEFEEAGRWFAEAWRKLADTEPREGE